MSRTQTSTNWAFLGFGGHPRYSASSPDEATLLTHLIADDTMVPTQFVPDRPRSPEQRLQWAVLENAIAQIRRPGSVKPLASRAAKQEALDWMLAEDEQGPFAFVSICEHLGLAPSRLRTWAREQRERLAQTVRRKRSQYRGARFDRRTGRWYAQIGKPNTYLGVYATQEEAALRYNEAAKERYGERAKLNVIVRAEKMEAV